MQNLESVAQKMAEFIWTFPCFFPKYLIEKPFNEFFFISVPVIPPSCSGGSARDCSVSNRKPFNEFFLFQYLLCLLVGLVVQLGMVLYLIHKPFNEFFLFQYLLCLLVGLVVQLGMVLYLIDKPFNEVFLFQYLLCLLFSLVVQLGIVTVAPLVPGQLKKLVSSAATNSLDKFYNDRQAPNLPTLGWNFLMAEVTFTTVYLLLLPFDDRAKGPSN